jgi:hypothetical protein
MSGVPEHLRFNSNLLENQTLSVGTSHDRPDGEVISIPSEGYIVELRLDSKGVRDAEYSGVGVAKVNRQRDKLSSLEPPPSELGLFGTAIDWAYRSYQVVRPEDRSLFRDYLYLFNVLVALEWQPDEADQQQIGSALRRASDLLFDITDGWMAIGQVVLGGPELMDAADIQVMASNRLHPRAWVGGMHRDQRYKSDEKYMPIRVGRGLWSDNRRGIIPWEEPEGYRTIVHEWGHYALKLTDEYFETRQVLAPAKLRLPDLPDHTLLQPPLTTVVMLTVATITDSIMASTEGTSELVSKQWDKLHTLYPKIPDDRDEVRPGPRRLPLPLPELRRIRRKGEKDTQAVAAPTLFFPKWSNIESTLTRLRVPGDIRLDHCWLYVLKGITRDKLLPNHLIAQGTLEERSRVEAFPLLAAGQDDTVVLIAEQRGQRPVVLRADVSAEGTLEWRDATPPAFPAIDVVPEAVLPNEPRAQLRARLNYTGDLPSKQLLPEHVMFFPLGQTPKYKARRLSWPEGFDHLSAPHDVPTLDGHVLAHWQDGSLLISPFSQGGDGPESGHPYPANPMNAGSADGNALLLMYREGDAMQAPRDIKVVTTLARGLSDAPTGGHERSYAFSIASNQPLPRALNPTLLMYYGPALERDEIETLTGTLCICRWQDGAGWVPQPTYLPPGHRFAIMPLDEVTGGMLIDPAVQEPRVEYYKVCWVPRNT